MWIVFAILALTMILFLLDRLPMELVGLMSLLALVLTGSIEASEALAGFSNSVVVVLAGLFVVGGALFKTGVASSTARLLERWSDGSPQRLLWLVMAVSAGLSAVMSSTGTAAVLIPAVVAAARKNRLSPSKYLIPLAYGCLIGGMITLIGTAPNLVVNAALRDSGRAGFGFLSFAPAGLAILVAAMIYLSTVGRRLLPEHSEELDSIQAPTLQQILSEYRALENLQQLRIPLTSRWTPRTLGQLRLRSDHGIDVLSLREPGTGLVLVPTVDSKILAGSTLFVRGQGQDLERFCLTYGATVSPYTPQEQDAPQGWGVAEVLLTPRSKLLGKSLAELNFARRYGVRVLKIRSASRELVEQVAETKLRFGDTLLLEGPWRQLQDLQRERFQFVVVGLPTEFSFQERLSARGWLSLALMAAMLLTITLGLLPTVVAVLLTAVLAILSGCLDMEEAYQSISWASVFLVATMLPMATALQKTGGLDYLTRGLLHWTGGRGPVVVLVGLFLLTALLSQVISNTATTVLLAPVALDTAQILKVAPEPLLMAVAIAASAAFLTPVASPVNTLVLGPGGYRFVDFVKVGLPLQLIVLAITTLMLPLLFPF